VNIFPEPLFYFHFCSGGHQELMTQVCHDTCLYHHIIHFIERATPLMDSSSMTFRHRRLKKLYMSGLRCHKWTQRQGNAGNWFLIFYLGLMIA